MYQAKLTSQGTLSLPAVVRRKYNLRAGDVLTIEDTGEIRLIVSVRFADMRKKNSPHVSRRTYTQGDGFSAHVEEKYGTK